MLEKVKVALRITGNAFDIEITDLIEECLAELKTLHIYRPEKHREDPQIRRAVIAYCKWQFGNNDDAERWEKIYRDKVTKLMVAEGYGKEG